MITPTERILTALRERECNPRPSGNGWSAKCPAHEDRRASLSLSAGDDGRALVKCHADCTVDEICGASPRMQGLAFGPADRAASGHLAGGKLPFQCCD